MIVMNDIKNKKINRILYQNMIYKFEKIDLQIIKNYFEDAKTLFKYPFAAFITELIPSEKKHKENLKEVEEYFYDLFININSILADDEKLNEEELKILTYFNVFAYFRQFSQNEQNISQLQEYFNFYKKYLNITFDNLIIEWFKNEFLYQLLFSFSIIAEKYEDGSIVELLNYLKTIEEQHKTINPQEPLEEIL